MSKYHAYKMISKITSKWEKQKKNKSDDPGAWSGLYDLDPEEDALLCDMYDVPNGW